MTVRLMLRLATLRLEEAQALIQASADEVPEEPYRTALAVALADIERVARQVRNASRLVPE